MEPHTDSTVEERESSARLRASTFSHNTNPFFPESTGFVSQRVSDLQQPHETSGQGTSPSLSRAQSSGGIFGEIRSNATPVGSPDIFEKYTDYDAWNPGASQQQQQLSASTHRPLQRLSHSRPQPLRQEQQAFASNTIRQRFSHSTPQPHQHKQQAFATSNNQNFSYNNPQPHQQRFSYSTPQPPQPQQFLISITQQQPLGFHGLNVYSTGYQAGHGMQDTNNATTMSPEQMQLMLSAISKDYPELASKYFPRTTPNALLASSGMTDARRQFSDQSLPLQASPLQKLTTRPHINAVFGEGAATASPNDNVNTAMQPVHQSLAVTLPKNGSSDQTIKTKTKTRQRTAKSKGEHTRAADDDREKRWQDCRQWLEEIGVGKFDPTKMRVDMEPLDASIHPLETQRVIEKINALNQMHNRLRSLNKIIQEEEDALRLRERENYLKEYAAMSASMVRITKILDQMEECLRPMVRDEKLMDERDGNDEMGEMETDY